MPVNWTKDIAKTVEAMRDAHYALLDANMATADLLATADRYADRVGVIDAAVILLSKAKWLYGRATGEIADFATRTDSADDLAMARELFLEAQNLAQASRQPDHATLLRCAEIRGMLSDHRTEIPYYQGTPIVPSICPVVMLTGSSRDMGEQYVRQCVTIFGEFVFSAVAARQLTAERRDVLAKWRSAMTTHTPEIVEMAEGMAVAASALGIGLTVDHALSMWTDLEPPSSELLPIGVLDAAGGGRMGAYFGAELNRPAEAEELCSGCAVWGDASQDGQLHYAASTDHDSTFQVTVIAFPETGVPFVYTPFSVNGCIPGTGRFGFAGHPGHNLAGVAYVHHGGGGTAGEPRDTWGYGVPRGALTFHVLRFAQDVKAARAMVLGMPAGNVGRLLGSSGGFYADASGGFVIEQTLPEPVVREAQLDAKGGTHPVLFATNNVQSPALASYGKQWGMDFNVEAGWHTLDARQLASGSPGEMTRRQWAASSESRNRFFYRHLVASPQKWSAESLGALFAIPPAFGSAAWKITEARLAMGEKLDGSPAHRLNAFVAVGSPNSGWYSACVGPLAHRSVSPNRPGHGYFYADETSAPWSIQLKKSPEETVSSARSLAERLLHEAETALRKPMTPLPERSLVHGWLKEARMHLRSSSTVDEARSIEEKARQLRAMTKTQVRCRQVLNALQRQD